MIEKKFKDQALKYQILIKEDFFFKIENNANIFQNVGGFI